MQFLLRVHYPCPTGSIDNWRVVQTVYSIEDQFDWKELPVQETWGGCDNEIPEVEDEIERSSEAPTPAWGPSRSAAPRPRPVSIFIDAINQLLLLCKATSGSPRRDRERRSPLSTFVRERRISVLEGNPSHRPPGTQADGRDNIVYSIASARDGRETNANNVGLTVKRLRRRCVELCVTSRWR